MTRPDRCDFLIRKARQDELVVERLVGDADVDDDVIGFHAQQAAEKLLKAALIARGIDYPRTHNLDVLIELLAAAGISLPEGLRDIDMLTPFGTTFRYDEIIGESGRDRARWLEWIRMLRGFVETLGS